MSVYIDFNYFNNNLQNYLIKDLINIIYSYYKLKTINPNILKHCEHGFSLYNRRYIRTDVNPDDLKVFENNMDDTEFKELYYFNNCFIRTINRYENLLIGKLSNNKYFELRIYHDLKNGFNNPNGFFLEVNNNLDFIPSFLLDVFLFEL